MKTASRGRKNAKIRKMGAPGALGVKNWPKFWRFWRENGFWLRNLQLFASEAVGTENQPIYYEKLEKPRK
ncbi:MAG: hypothetical protein EOM72_08620 [Opitutae bacterium]|nr:hypothetical protein [Opitutae bacterium]